MGAASEAKVVPAVRHGGGLAVIHGWAGLAERGIAIHQTLVTGHAHNQAALNRLRSAGSPICTACNLGGLRDSKLPGLCHCSL
jgi:hypothetical protein